MAELANLTVGECKAILWFMRTGHMDFVMFPRLKNWDAQNAAALDKANRLRKQILCENEKTEQRRVLAAERQHRQLYITTNDGDATECIRSLFIEK